MQRMLREEEKGRGRREKKNQRTAETVQMQTQEQSQNEENNTDNTTDETTGNETTGNETTESETTESETNKSEPTSEPTLKSQFESINRSRFDKALEKPLITKDKKQDDAQFGG